MRRITLQSGFLTLTLLLAGYFTLIPNLPILLHFQQILTALGEYKLGFVISIPLLLFAALNFVFTPFSIKGLFKPFFCVLLIVSAFASYAMLKYRVVFDKGMIENILETDSAEAGAYLNLSVVAWIVLTGVLPALLLARTRIVYAHNAVMRLGIRLVSMLISLLVVALIAALYYQDYASIGRNNRTLNLEIVPTNYLYSSVQYVRKRYFTEPIPFRKIGDDAKLVQQAGQKPTLLFVVVGETARAQNQSLGGYQRPTNAFTEKEPDLVYFSHVSSCGTATAISVPCMFSDLRRTQFDGNVARNSENVLDILQKAGVAVFWKDNDEGCKGACDRVPHQTVSTARDNALCDGSVCYDHTLLDNLDGKIPHDGKNKLIVLHLIGSHGPTYYKRYPDNFRAFIPDCPRSDIENCSQQELINTYDNTIRYTDYVVSQAIDRLKGYQNDYNVALYYLSDHGESLGEKGLYLHGTPYKFAPQEQTHVPMEVWMSPGYRQANNIDLSCLQRLGKTGEFSHDNLFHSLLSMMNVKTQAYDAGLDITRSCRKA